MVALQNSMDNVCKYYSWCTFELCSQLIALQLSRFVIIHLKCDMYAHITNSLLYCVHCVLYLGGFVLAGVDSGGRQDTKPLWRNGWRAGKLVCAVPKLHTPTTHSKSIGEPSKKYSLCNRKKYKISVHMILTFRLSLLFYACYGS